MCVGELLSQCCLRLLQPACALATRWSDEPLSQQTRRCVVLVHALSSNHPFPAPTLAYMFPLLQRAVDGGGEVVGGDHDVIIKVLNVLSIHAQLRSEHEVVEGEAVDEVRQG